MVQENPLVEIISWNRKMNVSRIRWRQGTSLHCSDTAEYRQGWAGEAQWSSKERSWPVCVAPEARVQLTESGVLTRDWSFSSTGYRSPLQMSLCPPHIAEDWVRRLLRCLDPALPVLSSPTECSRPKPTKWRWRCRWQPGPSTKHALNIDINVNS